MKTLLIACLLVRLNRNVMKTLLIACLLVNCHFSKAQEKEREYMREVEAKVSGKSLRSSESIVDGRSVKTYYYDDQLILLSTAEKGELANSIQTDYYLRNDTILVVRTRKCLTSNEILDLDLYMEANRDSTGKADLSGLPTDCLETELFCTSNKMTRKIEGNDVFDALPEFVVLNKKASDNYTSLLSAISTSKD